jgi:hypothetical protein
MMEAQLGFSNIELFSSLSDNMSKGRPKNFSREEVLEKAMPDFWKHGFADTSLQEETLFHGGRRRAITESARAGYDGAIATVL